MAKSTPRRRITDRVLSFATLLGPGAVFTGRFSGTDDYVVSGRVDGDCDIEGALVLQEGGYWCGDIHARHVVVAGTVQGVIHAREQLELLSCARVQGRLTAVNIAIAEGAVFEGEIRMLGTAGVTRFQERRRDPTVLEGVVPEKRQT